MEEEGGGGGEEGEEKHRHKGVVLGGWNGEGNRGGALSHLGTLQQEKINSEHTHTQARWQPETEHDI